ncbi:McbB family protein [Brevibacillus daliensis]|uniref:McbB family protein n=1 Tax=Brevibacillus daliensis TaxID=2892995 RepID=UPI001E3CE544|nr:McbB family protein [Brevibacillus daliensis]
MKYIINKYIAFQLENNDLVVQNQDSIVTITDEMLKHVLQLWMENNKTRVSIEEIAADFNEDTEDVVQFLEEYAILREEKPKKIDSNKITIVTNNHEVGELIYSAIYQDYASKIPVEYKKLEEIEAVDDDELLIVFLNPYSKKLARSITDKLSDSTKLVFSYIYNNNFYMDCLYSNEWKVPCHFCHVGHIEAQSQIENENGATYQQMIDSLYHVDENFEVNIPLSGVQKLNIARLLTNKTSRFLHNLQVSLMHPEEISNCTLLDLLTLKIYEDTSIHWEMCSCYES